MASVIRDTKYYNTSIFYYSTIVSFCYKIKYLYFFLFFSLLSLFSLFLFFLVFFSLSLKILPSENFPFLFYNLLTQLCVMNKTTFLHSVKLRYQYHLIDFYFN